MGIRGALIAGVLSAASPAHAKDVFLVCDGKISIPSKPDTMFGPTGASINIEDGTFTAPLISGPYGILRASQTDFSFGSETSNISSYGTLDRVSGALMLNQMTPRDRKILSGGSSVTVKLSLTGTCAVAGRMF